MVAFGFLSAEARVENAPGKIGISADYYLGKHVRHSPKIIPALNGLTHAWEVSCFKQTSGKEAWQRKLLYPEIGGTFYVAHNINPGIFGTTIGLMGTVKFFMLRSNVADLYIRLGSGAAFLTNSYHINRNPDNNVIGSTLNAMAQIKFGADFKPLPWFHISLAGALMHQSNGGIQQPNLGINVFAGSIGFKYYPNAKPFSYERARIPKPYRPNEFIFRFGIGITDLWKNGPKYPIYMATFAYARYTSIVNKVIAGITFEYNYAIRDFERQAEIGNARQQRMNAFTPSIFIGDEVIINRVGMLYAAGVYLHHPTQRTSWVYLKAGANYYPFDLGKNGTIKPYIGAHLKAHKAIAQTIEFCAGVLIR